MQLVLLAFLSFGFELVTRGFELATHGFELATRGFELVTRVLLFHLPYNQDELFRKNSSRLKAVKSCELMVLIRWFLEELFRLHVS